MAASLKEHLESLIVSLDKEFADASSDVCRAHEASERAIRRRDEASAKRAECVEALAKLYPVRQWASIDEVPPDVAVYGPTGVYWSYWDGKRTNSDGYVPGTGWLWTSAKSKPGFAFKPKSVGPFTEVVGDTK